ncbi:50S ribosomal protein L29 [Desulfonema limicola]|uniref:Large ribosomal subunit protein uL29 n=1 Tax=Desulfonema limicola TaxID=45656 RepID=A0A975B4Z1_9BACT|nr:50S ribosomal protein L29 [Desulfonema limicola]QTA78849.1 50S ribosomal protein L29 [Desulfonema limicola]
MKASEIRELTPDEIKSKVIDLKEELFNLRFQHGTGQLENPQKIKQTRRVLARMKTIIKENEINKAD